jgi:hypothetical protein
MNKTIIKTRIEQIKKLSSQDEHGQFEIGTPEQQSAARLVEDFYTNFDLSKETSEDELSITTAAVILALKDIQVRDYALGMYDPAEEKARLCFEFLTKHAPSKYIAAPTTLLALTYYEKHQDGKADEALAPALAQGYSLATLLSRVFQTNWPAGAFNSMRLELHPRVKAGIFGGTDDNSN